MLSFLLLSLIVGDSHGYDEYTTCDSNGRSSRQLELPSSCDMSANNFCYDKGQDYPDKAIKRFLQENLGLMKRMSSDMDSREVVREMRSGFNMWTQTDHYDDEGLGDEDVSPEESTFQINMMPPGENIFNGLKYNIKYGSGLATIKNVKDEAVKKASTSTTRTTTSHTTMMVTTSQSVTTSSDTSQPTVQVATTTDYIEPSTVTDQVMTSTATDQETTFTMQSRETPTEPPVTETEEFYPEYYPDYSQPQDYQQQQDYQPQYQQSQDYSTVQDYSQEYPVQSPQVQEQAPVYIEEVIEEELSNEDVAKDELIEELVEEVLEEEIEELDEIEYTGESVNACEVEESVTAPYWALNTRNDTLALLNLYPFEQYIHMERCKAEYDQMLCRPGCRCEQQYRLHRLLAFDPKNECRGIFSDWFRFPSFCICKCYNSAKQFKELTRSPKAQKMSPAVSARQTRKNLAESRLNNHRLMSMSGMEGMPAVFPYEGLAMITDEKKYNRDQRDYRVPRKMEAPKAIPETDEEESIIEKIAEEHMDNTVESDQVHYQKNVKQARFLDNDFFHNQPIVDFKLADGSMGSVEQVPRR